MSEGHPRQAACATVEPKTPLSDATYEELAAQVSWRLAQDREKAAQRAREIELAEKALDERRALVEEAERRVFAMTLPGDDIIELNVGGQLMSTTRAVLCCAEGSLLAGMFSGNFEEGHKRDKDGRVFLDVDPPLFAKLLTFLRLCRISTPDCPAPLPYVNDDVKAEYDMMIKYFGLDTFIYGSASTCTNICQRIAEMSGVCQTKLQTKDLVRLTLSTTGGAPATSHEEVLSTVGFHERSIENSYGAHPSVVTIRFLRHRVRVEAMELRAKLADLVAHMSDEWEFWQGTESCRMGFNFTRAQPSTGRLEVPRTGAAFVDEVCWRFPRDFCLEHIVLHGRVMQML